MYCLGVQSLGCGFDKPPMRFRPHVKGLDAGEIPSLEALGLPEPAVSSLSAVRFVGGETAGMARVREYFWDRVQPPGAWNCITPHPPKAFGKEMGVAPPSHLNWKEAVLMGHLVWL